MALLSKRVPDSLGFEDVCFWVKLRVVDQLIPGWILVILRFQWISRKLEVVISDLVVVEDVQIWGFRGCRRTLLIQGMKNGWWVLEKTYNSGRFWKLVFQNWRDVKNRGMSGDTYLFRRSPSIDRLGPDLSKSDRFPTFRDSWSRGIEGDPSIYRLEVGWWRWWLAWDRWWFERYPDFSICPFWEFHLELIKIDVIGVIMESWSIWQHCENSLYAYFVNFTRFFWWIRRYLVGGGGCRSNWSVSGISLYVYFVNFAYLRIWMVLSLNWSFWEVCGSCLYAYFANFGILAIWMGLSLEGCLLVVLCV